MDTAPNEAQFSASATFYAADGSDGDVVPVVQREPARPT